MASNGYANHKETGSEHDENLRNVLTNTVTITPEQFERMYLSPKTKVAGDLRKRFGNPAPVALLGFSVGLLPLSCAFMGWRGAGGNAVATTACSVWFGGFLLILAGIGEFILGNTFPMVVFLGYGAHFLTIATTFIPSWNAIGYFDMQANGLGTPVSGASTPMFNASFAYYPIALCLLSFVFLIGSLRTNLVFVLIFVIATIGFGLGGGAYFQLSYGNTEAGTRLVIGVGACFFGAMCLGWYLFLATIIAEMELPIPDLPVFDLSTVIKARPRRQPDQGAPEKED